MPHHALGNTNRKRAFNSSKPSDRGRWESFSRPAALFLTLMLLAVSHGVLFAEPRNGTGESSDSPDDEAAIYRPGLVAIYKGADGIGHARLENEVAFAWDGASPDRRIAGDAFEATFSGRVLVQTPGSHTLHAFAAGLVQVELAGKVIIQGSSADGAWLEGRAIELEFGYHPLVVRYQRKDAAARLALFWEGPGFGVEPLAARWLVHEAAATPSRDFEEGRKLVRALRCAACHDIAGEPERLPAPALDRLAGNLERQWIVAWLTDADARASRRMPHYGLGGADAGSVADYLLAESEGTLPTATAAPSAAMPRKNRNKKNHGDADKPEPPDAATGQRLFRSLGCLACHRVGSLGTDGLFGGGDLSAVAGKRPPDFFARWLTDPAAINRDHRMGVFALTSNELGHLAAYLQTLKPESPMKAESLVTSIDAGRVRVREMRCAACHSMPKPSGPREPGKRTPIDLAALELAGTSCLLDPDGLRHRPGYRLEGAQRRAIASFLRNVRAHERSGAPHGRLVLEERNCLACHARAVGLGLAAQLPMLLEAEPTLRSGLGSLVPPSLVGIGDKLQDTSLRAAIERSEPPRYDWLHVRMPKIPLSANESDALIRHFINTDRIPLRSKGTPAGAASAPDATVEAAGARLVTSDGFGCTSCHAIGKWKPQQVAPGAEGTDLTQLGRYIRREWFDRWVRDPARIVARMEMPAVRQPIRGVLDGDLERQLASVWHVLDRKGFTPPAPAALRVARQANMPNVSERAAILTDVIEVERRAFVKPIVIGLANRQNVLVDLASGRLAAWWIGDTARQVTRGKSWLWEGGAGQLLSSEPYESDQPNGEFALVLDGQRHAPTPLGQYMTELDYFEHVAGGVKFGYRLRFMIDGREIVLRICQEFRALTEADTPKGSGFGRRVQVDSFPPGAHLELEVLPGPTTLTAAGRTALSRDRGRHLEVTLISPQGVTPRCSEQGAFVRLERSNEGQATCELAYRGPAADQFLPPPVAERSVQKAELNVVPGFEAVRLPVSDRAMPTGLAWRSDAALVVSSLEGRVWMGRDTDGDGLEDQLIPFSDELAAPYGVAAHDDAIDVINKYGLLRLTDLDADGRADRTELLASGWGHTRDYHDWAIGLPRDAAGNYYVSLPCQQDDRSEAAAALRGTIIKLIPREPTEIDPRPFSIHRLCGGLRFANGLALNGSGDLFATDNQGNYTPFNELNHIVAGARYGFINRLESKPGFNPPVHPAAIEIPHPWTRSVNGICFLVTPPKIAARRGKLFGPFEGHLVGCEYDTRRLVRMSLEKVGGDYQGAVYPMSIEPAAGQETFEGPLVCQVSPSGDLYVGNIRDSGWGAGTNTGSLVRVRPRGQLPCGIAEVRADQRGFIIDFTQPVDPRRAADKASYQVSSYRRIATPAYGAPDADRRVETLKAVHLQADARTVSIEVDDLREGFVYEFHLANLAPQGDFFPAEAYYTLRHRK